MRILIFAAASLIPFAPASAAEDLRVRVGLGAQLRPEYPGADDTGISPAWKLSIARGTEPFRFSAPDDHFDIKLVSSGRLTAGPVANIEGGRKKSDLDVPIGKVSRTVELGAFAQYEVSESIRLRSDVRKGIGGHEGVIASIGGDRIWRDGDRYVFSIGPRLLVSDARYQRSWFGVSQAAAMASGLPAYRPGGGVHAVALTSGMTYQLNPKWGLFGFARYERLVGDAAKSPIVRQLGSKNQASGGIGLTYTFTVKR